MYAAASLECDNVAAKKRKVYEEDNSDERNTYTKNDPVRILRRRYLLTKTGYKYVDVGITVEIPPSVNVVIGDVNGKEISLSPNTWKKFIEKKETVLTQLQRGSDATSITIDDLGLRFGKINNLPILRLDGPTTRLVISQKTAHNLFELEHCINRLVLSLNGLIGRVDAKLNKFLSITTATAADAAKVIGENDGFDRDDIIDCELRSLYFYKL